MRGNKSFIFNAIKKSESNVDFDDRANVQRVLRLQFGIPALMDEVIFISKSTGQVEVLNQKKFSSKEEIFKFYWVHCPDLKINIFKFPFVVEIDGEVHWQTSKGINQTNERNYHYETAGIKMLWLTNKEAQSKPEELEKILWYRLNDLLGFRPIVL